LPKGLAENTVVYVRRPHVATAGSRSGAWPCASRMLSAQIRSSSAEGGGAGLYGR